MNFRNRKLVIVTLSILGLIVLVGLLEMRGTINLFGPKEVPVSTPTVGGASSTMEKGSTAANNNVGGDSSQENSSSSTDKIAADQTSSAKLITPSGTFVSAHKQVPLSANLSSSCSTTPGATCEIFFSNGTTKKSLPSKVADGNGAAYWEVWTPASIGLTSGSWEVTAVASLGNQTQSARDALNLEVAQ